ncbi:glycerophosphodiester phosphodiesterase family protein [Nafulsella turpanensis]|uniref:glycerophosphodiester phosphodiesterase family protein n=1 Tax=Nafulsella turpanensis TaxID=1265690 RepID=UPI000348D73A|nr:glycerophosphodiester phosphodiesterase family protein [Nafulsella turpanensis]
MKYRHYLAVLLLCLFSACTQQSQREEAPVPLHRIVLEDAEDLKEFFSWHPAHVPLVSAHRGGPAPAFPENAIETFARVLHHTYAIIETDISLTKDSLLVMMHDNTLDRTTTGKGPVIDYTLAEIQHLKLLDQEGNITPYRAPSLQEVLEWGRGKVVYTLDVKKSVPFEMVVDAVEEANAEAYSVIIAYSLRDALKIHELNPDLLISLSIQQPADLERAVAAGLPAENIIAFTGTSLSDPSLYQYLHEQGIYTILGTLGNLDKKAEARGDHLYRNFIGAGADILATDRPIEAAEALEPMVTIPERLEKYFIVE